MEQCQWVTCLITFITIATCLTRVRGNSGISFSDNTGESQCGSNKICVIITSCDTLNKNQNLANNKNRPRNCGWNGLKAMICCPVLKLEDIVNNTSECGIFNDNQRIGGVQRMKRVVGGHNAKRGSWPWMAAIFDQAIPSRKTPYCAGTLISTSSVLTTANTFLHSLRAYQMPRPLPMQTVRACMGSRWGICGTSKFVVVLGDLKLGDDIDGLTPIEVEVSRIIIHEKYKYPQLYNDIAILKLKTAVTFTPNIRMICLPGLALRNGNVNLDGKNATIAGWGHTTFGGSSWLDLQEASVPIVANSQCEKAYKTIASVDDDVIPSGITKDIICAGGDKKDSCQGDSGGPLAYNHEKTKVWILVGIISSGFECGTAIPGIYTRVSEYMDWIGLHM